MKFYIKVKYKSTLIKTRNEETVKKEIFAEVKS